MASPDFIEVYSGVLDRSLCRDMLDYFHRSKQATRGHVSSGVALDIKNSWDIQITGRPDWKAYHDNIESAVFRGLRDYVRKYRSLLLAPLAFRYRDDNGRLQPITHENLANLPPDIFDGALRYAFRLGKINIQRYESDQGGYPYWHCEHHPTPGSIEALHRVLLYTVYLNDEFEEGETEFQFQERKIKPQTGSLLIAPAFFTHTHRGNRPRSGDKYIATSWILFNPHEVLFR